METYTPETTVRVATTQGDLFATHGETSSSPREYWLREQLEASIKRLVRTVNTLVYTRNPVAVAVAAQQCDQLQHILQEFQARQQSSLAANCAVDELLLVETHQLLAEARRLVSVPLRPVWREDNVVELQPDYGDLTDAAFERMLASSDIPQLLCGDDPAGGNAQEAYWDDCDAAASSAQPKRSRSRAKLRLVYSANTPVDDSQPPVRD
ncbi:MAG: hypothetical protein HKO71_00600 [Pseudomonadales bacterium]|nr:hypothetical protein [Pseudomonadales bacterium]